MANPIWEAFDADNTLIKEYDYWKLCLRTEQNKVGRCVAILKRDAFPLSEVLPEEMAEYAQLVKDIEKALKETFGAYLVQYMCLMFVDKHVHFHIVPRYTEPVSFVGREWVDDNKPNPLIQEGITLLPNELIEMLDVLRKEIS
jgi:diadenosine tetraphosphate (Ap4A) HIT family hydrolase